MQLLQNRPCVQQTLWQALELVPTEVDVLQTRVDIDDVTAGVVGSSTGAGICEF